MQEATSDNHTTTIIYYENGSIKYKGEMSNGLPEGEGEYYNDNGEVVYEGIWRNGMHETEDGIWFVYISELFCTFYENGSKKYEGDMSNGLPEGNGIFYNENGGVVYIGEWENGMYKTDDGIWFVYANQQFCTFYENGLIMYAGEMSNKLPDGKGNFFNEDGKLLYEGVWKNGFYETEDGVWFDYTSRLFCTFYEDGSKRYEGEMKDKLPEGNGIYYNENGEVVYEGVWKNGLHETKDSVWFNYSNRLFCTFYKDGSRKYEGEMKGKLPDGEGNFYTRNGEVLYEGVWKNGLFKTKDGVWFDYIKQKLCTFYENGSMMYIGEMTKRLPDGNGTYYNENGEMVYEGVWKNGLYETKDGVWFNYSNRLFCTFYEDGSKRYEGEMKDGLPEGNGTYYNETGEVLYEGVWKNGMYERDDGVWFNYSNRLFCTFYEDGSKKYEGEMKGKLPDGEGIFYTRNGEVLYEGVWKNGLFKTEDRFGFLYSSEQFCILYENDSIMYVGEMNDGIPEGNGAYYSETGEVVFIGVWKNGLYETDEGVWFNYSNRLFCTFYKNGAKKYEGEMKGKLPDGEGKFYTRNGEVVYEGVWKNGLYERDDGTWFDYTSRLFCTFYEDGSRKYEGEMSNGLPDGNGTYYNRNGSELYTGYWIDGEIHVKRNKWFCYLNGKIEKRRNDSDTKMTKKRAKNCIISLICTIILLALIILAFYGVFSGWFFRFGSGFLIEDGVLTISEGNYLKTNFRIEGYPNVTTIVIKKGSLQNLRSLTICDCDVLETIIVEDGSQSSSACENVTKVELSNLPQLTSLHIGAYAFYHTNYLNFSYLPRLNTFKAGYSSFYQTSLNFSNLTELKTFTAESDSFANTKSITLTNVPFTDGEYLIYRNSSTFHNITSTSITADLLSQHLRITILKTHEKLVSAVIKTPSDLNAIETNKNENVQIEFAEGDYDAGKDLLLSGYENLKSIIVKENALKNLTSLTICGCDVLETIIVEDYSKDSKHSNVATVEISSNYLT